MSEKQTACLICENETKYFFSKEYSFPYKDLLSKSDYWKCSNCGFTYSKTLFDMNNKDWKKLNFQFHTQLENFEVKAITNQPPFIQQANMLNILLKNNIVDKDFLDYAGGYGTLSKIMSKYYNFDIPIYDPFVQSKDVDLEYIKEASLKIYKTVFNSAYFEHIRGIEDLNKINDLVHEKGALIIHTVICENIPSDPNWFYLQPPVHSAFHTNKSMDILMIKWDYLSSIYCPSAKCWILLKTESENLEKAIIEINKEFQNDFFIYKKGFVDYWKGF